jgi:hypothetical protein
VWVQSPSREEQQFDSSIQEGVWRISWTKYQTILKSDTYTNLPFLCLSALHAHIPVDQFLSQCASSNGPLKADLFLHSLSLLEIVYTILLYIYIYILYGCHFLRRLYNILYFLWLYNEFFIILYNILKIAELDCCQIIILSI